MKQARGAYSVCKGWQQSGAPWINGVVLHIPRDGVGSGPYESYPSCQESERTYWKTRVEGLLWIDSVLRHPLYALVLATDRIWQL